MKKFLKYLMPSIILAFSISFMACIYEPITMYGNNIEDFWFDLKTLIVPSLLLFFVCFGLIVLLFFLIFGINIKFKIKKFNPENKYNVYQIILVVINALFIASYIEGNYLAGFLPPLDGTKIVWKNYTTITVISTLIWLFIVIVFLLLYHKKNRQKLIKMMSYLNIVICIMLSVSLITTFTTTEVMKAKEYKIFDTTKFINKYSKNKNFIIFLVDAVDSREFVKVNQKNGNYKKTFDNFTYYPDTTSVYIFTRDSVPLILSGKVNYNEKDFKDYYNYAMDNSYLFKKLEESNYEMNIYDYEFMYSSENAKTFKNVVFDNGYNKYSFIKQEVKYILFKYLPFGLKKYSRIETMNFNNARDNVYNLFDWSNKEFYNNYSNILPEVVDKNQFKFIHIEGGHTPFDIDENVNFITNGSYHDKLKGTTTIITKYINYLKENNLYDNSVIIVMADHGYDYVNSNRTNPILYVKGVNEKHNYQVSDKAVSHLDFDDMYSDLISGKTSDKLFKNLNNKRDRKIIWYEYLKEDHMVEYVQKGKAWDQSTLVPTGKEYNR